MFARIANEWRLRGALGLVRFIGTRLVRRKSELVFTVELPLAATLANKLDEIDVHIVDRSSMGTASSVALSSQVLCGDNEQYREGLGRDELLFVSADAGRRVQCYGFVLFDTPYKRVLGLAREIPLIANCFTVAAVRGMRLYPRLLRSICAALTERGFTTVAISCEADNVASIRGIERAGFVGREHIRCWVVLSRLVVLRTTTPYGQWASRSAK